MLNEEEQYELILALVRSFDKHITPLASNIKCWKFPASDGMFTIGITITKYEFKSTTPRVLHYMNQLPMKYWPTTNVIHVDEPPIYSEDNNIDALRSL